MIAQQEELKKVMSAERPSTTAFSQPDDHLNLLLPETETPWYKSFVANIRELINPPKLPPLEVTSKPIPVKVIWGEQDAEIPLEDGKHLHREIPDARLIVFRNCGHLPQEEYPEEFVELLTKFVSSE